MFRGGIRVHLDHKNPTFDKMHQGSQLFHFKIHYLNRNLAGNGFLVSLWPIGSIKVPTISLFYDPQNPKY